MTTKIEAIIGFYQDRKAGERLLKNLESYDIPSRWGDGRINGFPTIDNSNMSTDGFREIIKSSKRGTLVDIGLHGPGDLINTLLQSSGSSGYDYTFTLGCDEYLTGDFELFKDSLERIRIQKQQRTPARYKVRILEHNPEHNRNQKYIAERVTFMPKYVQVKQIHWLYYSFYNGEDRILGDKHDDPLVFGIDLHHDDTIREAWRNQLMDKFQATNNPREWAELERIMTERYAEDFKKIQERQRKLKTRTL